MFHLPESIGLAELIQPQTMAAGKNGINICLKNYQKAYIVCIHRAGAHAAQETYTLAQSSGNAGDAAGTNEKAMTNNVPIYFTDDFTLTADGSQDVTWTTTSAKAKQVSNAQAQTHVVIFEVVPEVCMDLDGGFDCVTVNSTGSDVAHIGCAYALLVPRYAPPLSVTID